MLLSERNKVQKKISIVFWGKMLHTCLYFQKETIVDGKMKKIIKIISARGKVERTDGSKHLILQVLL
jgi:hypothetical protein